MKKMRKIISLIVALAFLFSIAAPAMAAEPTAAEKAGNRLLALKIIEGYTDGTLGLDKQITRAEIAVILAKASGMATAADMLKDTPSKFSDVKVGEWYTGWINLAASQGWVKGDPQGTFRPNDPVSYREIVTMVMKILGYNDNLPGDWPTDYLAKAASLGITKGISFDSKAPAVRGDVFQISSKALDEDVVTWDADNNEFESKDVTLLEDKLDFTKKDGVVVTAIPRVDSSLDDDEIEIDGKTYEVVGDIDFEAVFGAEVTVSLNDDNEVVNISVDSEDILYDAIEWNKDDEELKLVDADKEYDLAEDVIVYISGDKKDVKDLATAYEYAKVVLNDEGDVAFIDAYDFDYIVVEEVDGNIVSGYGDELDLEDYAVVKDGITISVEDIKAGDILFYNKDGKFAEVFNKTVEGEIEKVYDNSFKVAGEEFDIDGYYADDDELQNLDADALDDMKAAEGEVTVFLARDGSTVVFVSGDLGEADTATFIGYVRKDSVDFTDRGKGYSTLDVINEQGEEVNYDIPDTDITDADEEFFIDASGSVVRDVYQFQNAIKKDALVEITVDEDNDVTKVKLLAASVTNTDGAFEIGDKYVKGYRLQGNNDAVVFLAEEYQTSNDTDDIKVSTLGELDFEKVDSADIYADEDGEVIAIVVKDSDRDADYTEYVAVALKDSDKVKGEDTWKLELYFDGKEQVIYTEADKNVANASGVLAGDIIEIKVGDKSGEIKEITTAISEKTVTGTVSKVSVRNDEITVAGSVYELTSDAVVLDVQNKAKEDIDVINLRDIENNDNVTVYKVASNSRFVNVVLLNDEAADPSEGVVEGKKIEAVDTDNDVFVYDGEGYKVISTTVLYAKDGTLLASGGAVLDDSNILTKRVTIELSSNIDTEGNVIVKKITYME